MVTSAIPAAVLFVQANRFSPLNVEIEAVVVTRAQSSETFDSCGWS